MDDIASMWRHRRWPHMIAEPLTPKPWALIADIMTPNKLLEHLQDFGSRMQEFALIQSHEPLSGFVLLH